MWGKDNSKKVDFDRHAGKTTMISKGTEIVGDVTGALICNLTHSHMYKHNGTDKSNKHQNVDPSSPPLPP